jgi:SAM-dependent methyltransferase
MIPWNKKLLETEWEYAPHKHEHTPQNRITIPERMVVLEHPKRDRLVTGMFYKYSLILPLLPPEGRILDACSGAGFGASTLAASGYEVVAMDAQLPYARWRQNITCVEEDIHNFHTNGGDLYDAIVMVDAIEHLKGSHQIPALQHLYSLLKPGGWFLIDTPRVRNSGRQSGSHPSCLNWDDFLKRFQTAGEWSEYQRYLLSFEHPVKGGPGFTISTRVRGEPPEGIPNGADQIIIGKKADV